MDVEQRVRELLAQAFGCEPGELLPVEVRAVRAVLAYHAALTPPEGHVVVTRNEAGQAVAVTRQDDEGRILSVIAELGPTAGWDVAAAKLRELIDWHVSVATDPAVNGGYVLVPLEPTEEMLRAGRWVEPPDAHGQEYIEKEGAAQCWKLMMNARPEVKP